MAAGKQKKQKCDHDELGVYDQLKPMLREIQRFGDRYQSFSTNKAYTNLLEKTASGLIRDVAADTQQLNAEEIRQHRYSKEVFAAFVMFFCAKKVQQAAARRKTDAALAGDVVYTVYGRILNRIKRDLESEGECRYVRNLIKCSAGHALSDLLRKEEIRGISGIPDEKKPTVISGFNENAKNKDDEKIPDKFERIAAVGGFVELECFQKSTYVQRALIEALKSEILSRRELDSLCYHFGIGDGYRKKDGSRYSNNEVAEKFGVSASRVTTIRSDAIKHFRKFILNNPQWKEVFF